MARLFWVTAISMVGAARAVPMSSVQPVFAFTLGIVLLGEPPNLLVTMGTPVIVAGLLPLVIPRPVAESAGPVVKVRRLGYVLALSGAATFASRDVISRHVVSDIASPLDTGGLAWLLAARFSRSFCTGRWREASGHCRETAC